MFKWLAAGVSVCVLAGLGQPAASVAEHVSAAPKVTARGGPFSDRSWRVVVDWSINCSVSGGSYHGDLKLVDADTDETTFLGGTAAPSGTNRPLVERRRVDRRVYPVMRSSCGGPAPLYHGSDTLEARGNTVLIPALGDNRTGGGSDRDAGGQGRRDFPRTGFGGPRSPLRPDACGTEKLGTQGNDRLNGTGAADLIFGLGGNDRIGGRADDDCLIGGSGRDRLVGASGWDRLTGGRGRDTLLGGSGKNRYDAGAGNDLVLAANNRAELVSCGTGRRDRARVDRADRVHGCERVRRVR